MGHEFDGAPRIERGKDLRMAGYCEKTQDRDDNEPQQHHGSEGAPDALRAEALPRKQPNQYCYRHGHDERFKRIGGDIDPLDRTEHGDGGRDDAVAIDQRGAEQPHAGKRLDPTGEAVGADE